jgi:phosphoesterase RecJ-like protein
VSQGVAVARGGAHREARGLVEGARRVVLTTHVQPDGDGIGSEVALARWLTQQGKDVAILNPHPTQRRFRFLQEIAPVEAFDPERHEGRVAEADLLVVLDISTPARLGSLEPVVRRYAPRTLIIDHHADASTIEGVDVRDIEAAATGEIVYRLLVEWGAAIDPLIATALYAAIAYDTGGFRHGNTRAETHEIAADLVRKGADLALIRRYLFESMSESRARLLAHALSSYERSLGGTVAWVSIPRAMLDAVGADPEDVEGVAEALRAIEGVEVAIVTRELRDNATKVSFRSRGENDVNAFARRFGGGGHRNAAGAYIEEPLAEVVSRLVPAARKAFDPAER